MKIAEDINVLGAFCGKRDISRLTQDELLKTYGFLQADVFVLFGGSILEGGNVLAEAIKEQVAKHYIIVGGAGHTTETLRRKMHQEFPDITTQGLAEAEVFERYLERNYNLHVDYLECKSTNCGNNITFLLELLQENNISCKSIILAQDATMQHRMEAGLRKHGKDEMQIINYATYKAHVTEENGELRFMEKIWGMWDMDRYITLLMGEIPRLTDDENGYGPQGQDYIAHVDIPLEVTAAFGRLKEIYSDRVREANPLYKSSGVK